MTARCILPLVVAALAALSGCLGQSGGGTEESASLADYTTCDPAGSLGPGFDCQDHAVRVEVVDQAPMGWWVVECASVGGYTTQVMEPIGRDGVGVRFQSSLPHVGGYAYWETPAGLRIVAWEGSGSGFVELPGAPTQGQLHVVLYVANFTFEKPALQVSRFEQHWSERDGTPFAVNAVEAAGQTYYFPAAIKHIFNDQVSWHLTQAIYQGSDFTARFNLSNLEGFLFFHSETPPSASCAGL